MQQQHVSMYLGEIHAESAHIQSIEEAAKALVEAIETLVQELQVHEVGFQIGHAVAQLGECWFECC
jgi:hypothetical protein